MSCFFFLHHRVGNVPGLKRKRVRVSSQQNNTTDPQHNRRSLKHCRSTRDVQPALSSALSHNRDFRPTQAPSQSEEIVEK